MRIRAATPGDIPAIKAIERGAGSAAHWAEAEYERVFGPELRRIVLIAEALEPQGFIIGKVVGPECEVENVVVAEPSRGHGVGSALLRAFLDRAASQGAKEAFLEVRESNAAARMLYKRCGFREAGRRREYYRDPLEDAVLYQMSLAGSS